MSTETKSIISVRDSATTFNHSSPLVELPIRKHYCFSSRSALISTFSFIIISNFVNLAYPVIYVFDNGLTLNTINALIATVGIYFVVKERVDELAVFAFMFTTDISINLGLSIAKLVYVDTTFCSDYFSDKDLDNCYSQAKVYVIVASITCALAILVLGTVLYNLYDYHRFLKAKLPDFKQSPVTIA